MTPFTTGLLVQEKGPGLGRGKGKGLGLVWEPGGEGCCLRSGRKYDVNICIFCWTSRHVLLLNIVGILHNTEEAPQQPVKLQYA